MASDVCSIQLTPDFVEADDAIEALNGVLHNENRDQSLTQMMAKLEEIYHRGSEEVRYKVLTNLIDIEYVGARALLRDALLSDRSALVRHEAAFGLGIIGKGTPDANTLVHAMLSDENFMVRHEAAIALSSVGGDNALGVLLRAAKDESPEVAGSARFAIQCICLKAHRDSE